jgi:glucose-1-phosphate cytidylyltransferase
MSRTLWDLIFTRSSPSLSVPNGKGASGGRNGAHPNGGSALKPGPGDRMAFPRVSIVIPAKNEARNLELLLPGIPHWVHEVILVDGRSTDGTVEAARHCRPDIRVVAQLGWGKGEALRAGFAAVTGEIIVTLDADNSADPAEIPAFVGALLGGADYAKGSRFVQGGGSADITVVRKVGNWGLTTLVRLLFGHRFTDLCYGYNALWTRVVPLLDLDRDGFEVETLMNIRALLAGLKVAEVASFEAHRIHGLSGLRTFRDGWQILKIIIREWMGRHRRLQAAAMLGAVTRTSPPGVQQGTTGTAPALLIPLTLSPLEMPEVVILCGGRGSRLGAVTDVLPKALVQVGGRPILHHIMSHYANHGFKHFTLCLGYGGDLIREYFLNYQLHNRDFSLRLDDGAPQVLAWHGERLDWRVTCVETGPVAQTGARLQRVQKYIQGSHFLCTYGDGLSDIDIPALLAFHRQHGGVATLTGVRPPWLGSLGSGRFGEMVIGDGDRVLEFNEKPNGRAANASGYINGGFFVFERRIFDYLSADESCILERAPLERLAADGQLRVFRHQGFWQCMDTVEDRDRLERLLVTPSREFAMALGNDIAPPAGA